MVAVPLIASQTSSNRRYFSYVLSSTVFFTLYTNSSRVHFVSMEDYRGPDRGFEVSLVDLIFLGLIPAVVSKKGKQWLPYNILIQAFYALVCVVSSFTCGSAGMLFALFTCFKMVKLVFVYWVCTNAFKAGLRINDLAQVYLVMALFLTFTALKQKYLWGFYRIIGPFDHSNTIPMYIAMLIPPLYLWASCQPGLPKWKTVAGAAGCLGLMFCILATQSRAGIFLVGGSLGASVFLSVVRSRRMPKTQMRRVHAMAAVIMLLAFLGGLKALNTIITRFKTAPEQSEEARVEFNIAAKLMLKDHPMTGIGINGFSRVLTKEVRYNGHIVVMANEEQAGVAHHIYWLTAAELGYPGIIAFVLIWFRMWYFPLRTSLRGKSFEYTFLVGFPLGFQTLYLIGFLEWAFRLSPVMYLYTIQSGIAVGLATELLEQNHSKRSKKKAPKQLPPPTPSAELKPAVSSSGP
jgi:hypothetical protein